MRLGTKSDRRGGRIHGTLMRRTCCSVKERMGDGQDGSWLCRSVSNSAFVMCVDFRVQCDLERDNVERKVTTSIVMARVSDRWPSAYTAKACIQVPKWSVSREVKVYNLDYGAALRTFIWA